jgi:hypothetical protein
MLTRLSAITPPPSQNGERTKIAAPYAKGGQSTGPLQIGRAWDAYTDDHIGLMDHLGIR